MKRFACFFHFIFVLLVFPSLVFVSPVYSQESDFPQNSQRPNTELNATRPANRVPFIDLSIREPKTNEEVAFSVQLLILITLLSLAPSILLLMTSFLRLSIALDFVKRSLSLQQVPPTQVLNGIALFFHGKIDDKSLFHIY